MTTVTTKDGFTFQVKGDFANSTNKVKWTIKSNPTNGTALNTALIVPKGSFQSTETVIPADTVQFASIEVPHFLKFYADFSKAQLDTNQLGELRGRYFAFTNKSAISRSELIRLFDEALYNQVGIVASHQDAEHVVFKLRSSEDKK